HRSRHRRRGGAVLAGLRGARPRGRAHHRPARRSGQRPRPSHGDHRREHLTRRRPAARWCDTFGRRRTEEVEVRSRRRADAAQRGVGVIVLVLIVMTQAMRPSMRDAAIFVLPALALLIDAVRPLPALPSLPPARSRVGLAALLLAAAVLVLTPRYGNADMLALILLGLAAGTTAWGSTDRLTAAWSQLPPTRRRPVRRAGIAWAIVLVTLAL